MANRSFYISKQWKHKRASIMRRDHYEDQEAKRYGRTVTATMVHHIYPVTEYPELRFKSWNLISLSNASHNAMHDRETQKIIKSGIIWQKRRKRQFDEFYQK